MLVPSVFGVLKAGWGRVRCAGQDALLLNPLDQATTHLEDFCVRQNAARVIRSNACEGLESGAAVVVGGRV